MASRKLLLRLNHSSRLTLHTWCMQKTSETSRRRPIHRSALVAMLGIAVAGVLLAACGSSASSSSGTTTTTAPSTTKTSAPSAAFASCLKSHGVSAPTGKRPTGGAGGAPGAGGTPPAGGFSSNPKASAAFKACASLRPAGSFGGGGGGFAGGGSGASSTALAAFRNCMTLHGVTIAKKTSSSTGGAATPNSSITSNPKYKTAYAACKTLLPSPTSTTTTP